MAQHTSITALEQFGRRLALIELKIDCDFDAVSSEAQQQILLEAWRRMCRVISREQGKYTLSETRVLWSCEQCKWQYVMLAEVYNANMCFR